MGKSDDVCKRLKIYRATDKRYLLIAERPKPKIVLAANALKELAESAISMTTAIVRSNHPAGLFENEEALILNPLNLEQFTNFWGFLNRIGARMQPPEFDWFNDQVEDGAKLRPYFFAGGLQRADRYFLANVSDSKTQIAISAGSVVELARKAAEHKLLVVHTDQPTIFLDGQGNAIRGDGFRREEFASLLAIANL